MPIDPQVAVGALVSETTFSWSTSDVLLYHLAVGAGARPGDNVDPRVLCLTSDESDLQVLPSFGVVVPSFRLEVPPSMELPGCDFDLAQVFHGSQEIRLAAPVSATGTATVRTTITDVWDKEKAAVIWQESVATAPSGKELWTARSSIFVRGEGGWGGERGALEPVVIPDRAPDAVETYEIPFNQALLYRLCGDRNPLHSDPPTALAAGFPAPILHGLCTYGIVLRELTRSLLDGDAGRVGEFGAKFAGVVYPGETLRVRSWDHGGRFVAVADVVDAGGRRGAPVLTDVVLAEASR